MEKVEQASKVYRITVDERLSEDLIRLEVCKLKNKHKSEEFSDEPEIWEDIFMEGEEILARPLEPESFPEMENKDSLELIVESLIKKIEWKNLTEGQVFLLGEYDIREDTTGKRYYTRPGVFTFNQIDDAVYDNTKILYYNILGKEAKHG